MSMNRAANLVLPWNMRFKFKAKGANRDAWVTKQSVVIPARPFLGINEENAQRLLDIAEGYLAAGVFE
jgi:phage gpG-like protein